MPRLLPGALFAVALALADAAAAHSIGGGVDTDLYSLVGGGGFLSALNGRGAGVVRVMCADAARAEKCRGLFRFDAPLDPAAFLDKVRTHGRGLLSAKSREMLENGDVDRIRRAVKRRDYSGVGLFPKSEDPNYFLSDFVASLKSLQPEGLSDGAQILLGEVRGDEDAEGLRGLVELACADDGVWLSGAPFHTLVATDRTKRDIGILGAVSLAAVFALGWLLFRSFRFVVPTSLALACGFAAGAAAVCLLPGRPHVLTFLFGTTLVGLGVDYCYHALGERHDAEFRRSLFRALLTTCLAFSPLAFSHVAVLRQMSVFTIVGLTATWGFVVFMGGGARATDGEPRGEGGGFRMRLPHAALVRTRIAVALAVMAVAAIAAGSARFSSDPALFHIPAPVMARGEAKFAEVAGGMAGRIVLVPLARWQEENARLKAKVEEPRGEFLTADDLPGWMTVSVGGEDFLMLPEKAASGLVPLSADGVRIVDLRGELASLFKSITRETYRLLCISFAVLAAVMIAVFRRRFFSYAMPVAAAAASTFAALVAFGQQITFFHLLCFFIMIGLGIDYVIFHNAAPLHRAPLSASMGTAPSSRRIVLFSFLTSFIGFGLLSFTAFPVTRSMGITLAIGLLFSFLFSAFSSFPSSVPSQTSSQMGTVPNDWAMQGEQSAGRMRILVIWWIYRLLGKTAAKLLFLPAYLFIYPFCRNARASLRQYYSVLGIKGNAFRHILEFSWSLIDKTDACSLCKDPPRFAIEGDDGWMKGGCFLVSAHLGCIEVLPALRKNWGQFSKNFGETPGSGAGNVVKTPKVHAFQQMGHDAVFTEIFTRNINPDQLTLHAVEDIGVETAVEMRDAISHGDIVLMAGDRLPAKKGDATKARSQSLRKRELEHVFLGRTCRWPKGVFRFAAMMESPVYAIVCVKTGWNAYSVAARRLVADDLLGGYAAFLEEMTRRYPLQWYQFYRFF